MILILFFICIHLEHMVLKYQKLSKKQQYQHIHLFSTHSATRPVMSYNLKEGFDMITGLLFENL